MLPFGVSGFVSGGQARFLYSIITGFAGADADGLFNGGHENLAVADLV
jgi:hypothetical protein